MAMRDARSVAETLSNPMHNTERNPNPSKSKGKSARSSSGAVVRVRVSSAIALIGEWERRKNHSSRLNDSGVARRYFDARHRDLWRVRETAISECLEDIRRLLALPSKRQPHPNIPNHQRAESAERIQ